MNQTQSDPSVPANPAIGRWKLIALMAIYAAPLIAAWLWLGYVRSNEGAGVSVNGELIRPAVPLSQFTLTNSDGDPWRLNQLEKKWSMVYFSGESCQQQCEQTLYNMRQIRLSTGRRMDRVQRVLVTSDLADMSAKLAGASEGLAIVGGGSDDIASLRAQISAAEAGMPACVHCIYLVDPFTNVMMRFPPELDPKKAYKDLKHLLKVSRIG